MSENVGVKDKVIKEFFLETVGDIREMLESLRMFTDETPILDKATESKCVTVGLIVSAKGKGTRLVVSTNEEMLYVTPDPTPPS